MKVESSADKLKRKIAERQQAAGGRKAEKKAFFGRFAIPSFKMPVIVRKFIAVVRNDIDRLKTGREDKIADLIRKREEYDDFMENYFLRR